MNKNNLKDLKIMRQLFMIIQKNNMDAPFHLGENDIHNILIILELIVFKMKFNDIEYLIYDLMNESIAF